MINTVHFLQQEKKFFLWNFLPEYYDFITLFILCLFGKIFLSYAHTFLSIVALCNTSDRCNLTKKKNGIFTTFSDKVISKIIFKGFFF